MAFNDGRQRKRVTTWFSSVLYGNNAGAGRCYQPTFYEEKGNNRFNLRIINHALIAYRVRRFALLESVLLAENVRKLDSRRNRTQNIARKRPDNPQ